MADDNFGAIMVPGPRPWWRTPALVVGGLVVVAGGTYGVLQLTHQDPHPVAVTIKTPVKKKDPATVATGPATPPNYVPQSQPASGKVFQSIAAINNRYIAW